MRGDREGARGDRNRGEEEGEIEECIHSIGTFERVQYRYSRIEVISVRRRER